MPSHRGVVIRADHSGLGSAAGRKRLPPVVYRAVFRDKVFKGSLDGVMQQIDDALGSLVEIPRPLRLPPPPVKKAVARRKSAKTASRKAPQRPARAAKKKAKRK